MFTILEIMQCINKIALVTGAADGFGLATVKLLIEKGYKVACCDSSFNHKSPDSNLVQSLHGIGNVLFCGMDSLNDNDVCCNSHSKTKVCSVLNTIQNAYGEAPSVIVNCERLIESEEVIMK